MNRLKIMPRAGDSQLVSPLPAVIGPELPSSVLRVIKGSHILAIYCPICNLGLIWSCVCVGVWQCLQTIHNTTSNSKDSDPGMYLFITSVQSLPLIICEIYVDVVLCEWCCVVCTFSICSASRRSLGSLRLGLKVSGSNSVLMDASCLEFTSSLVVIYKHKYL